MSKKLSNLFPGIQIYDTHPVEVKNPFTGEGITLQPEEIAVYDYLKGCELMGDYQGVRRGIDWFINNNIEAYSVLLD